MIINTQLSGTPEKQLAINADHERDCTCESNTEDKPVATSTSRRKNDKNQNNSQDSLRQNQGKEEETTKIRTLTPKRRRSIKTKMADQSNLHPEFHESVNTKEKIEHLTSRGKEEAITTPIGQPFCSKRERDIKNKMADQQNRQLPSLRTKINEIQQKLKERKFRENLRNTPKTEITKWKTKLAMRTANNNQEPGNLKKEENINEILKRKAEYLPEESNKGDEPVRKKDKINDRTYLESI